MFRALVIVVITVLSRRIEDASSRDPTRPFDSAVGIVALIVVVGVSPSPWAFAPGCSSSDSA
ncbi:hypothetical protein [Streptomyces sp. NPDC002587]